MAKMLVNVEQLILASYGHDQWLTLWLLTNHANDCPKPSEGLRSGADKDSRLDLYCLTSGNLPYGIVLATMSGLSTGQTSSRIFTLKTDIQ